MKSIINFFKSNAGKIFLFSALVLALIITSVWGIQPGINYVVAIVIIFFVSLVWRVYPDKRKTYFYNRKGRFEMYDVVYDRGSAVRPNLPGILKHDGSVWFIVYEDGFEWVMSDPNNIEKFIFKSNK